MRSKYDPRYLDSLTREKAERYKNAVSRLCEAMAAMIVGYDPQSGIVVTALFVVAVERIEK
ncbi:hypothetical protein FACS1894103_0250 [Campylobacterota bacterium]|nr:hypothetical protein FACS1894103_0250 [Campylobacterota bacterium]